MFFTKLFNKVATVATVFMVAMSSVQVANAASINDNFANALQITNLPFSVNADNSGATFEAGELNPTCGSASNPGTVWYSYAPTSNTSLTASSSYYSFPPVLAIYTGSLGSLTQIACANWYPSLTFPVQAGVTYYFQLSGYYGDQGVIPFSLVVTPPPEISMIISTFDPSIYDTVSFSTYGYDPGGVYGYTSAWTISDGTTSDQNSFTHQFIADGDYTVHLVATTSDGRSGIANQVIQVRTKDVVITKFSIPQTARANQMKTISVDVQNKRQSDNVQVSLFKGLAGGGLQGIGAITLYVPAQTKQVTTFKFNYLFTSEDAMIGKATFTAVATFENGRDALPSDNTAIGTTTVSR